MVAFIIAGIVFVCTLILCGIMVLGAGMSDSPSASGDVPLLSTFIIGTILAVLIAASHWLHMSW